jgi:hypothetical protein
LHAMGEDDEKRGNLDLALKKFTEAHRATAAVLAQRPNDPEAIFAHSQSEYWIGYEAFLLHRRVPAFQSFFRYKNLAERIATMQPNVSKWQREAAYSEGTLCSTYLEAPKEPQLAIRFCERALGRMQVVGILEAGNTQSKKDIANRHGWLAEAYGAEGDLQKAMVQRELQRTIVETLLTEYPADMSVLELWVAAHISMGKLQIQKKEYLAGKQTLMKAKRRAQQLIDLDPENNQYAGWLNQIHNAKKKE